MSAMLLLKKLISFIASLFRSSSLFVKEPLATWNCFSWRVELAISEMKVVKISIFPSRSSSAWNTDSLERLDFMRQHRPLRSSLVWWWWVPTSQVISLIANFITAYCHPPSFNVQNLSQVSFALKVPLKGTNKQRMPSLRSSKYLFWRKMKRFVCNDTS